ncbi:MAG: transglutaminase family protein [Gomphosphaeria aponina SAG 52.96 = DSM 107014]|uniref:Transglutaminase family protein n=1 Tax=Gomphosphaeria aponina SAG 52.96 = DSM 107014 TaxID=1521640 RepID=A0A941GVE0_9CHRO|nr:transglutaminase family protein [Gomphosphaeria aponina SAG 52.96 = DSM 107014]
MKFQIQSQLKYRIDYEATFIFNFSIAKNAYQKVISEELEIKPQMKIEEYISPALRNRYLRINVQAGNLEVNYRATVELCYVEENPNSIREVPLDVLPLDTFYFLYPSRYCQSDRLMSMANQEFGDLLPDYSRVTAICNWIYNKVSYMSGSTDSNTSAYDTATERAGVCRDFAHLGIAFCRALNIPARFVSCYAYNLEPPDFHACFEAYLGDRWYLFDPTRLVSQKGIIRIGTGKDAADVAFATIFGTAELEEKNIIVQLLDNQSLSNTVQAIAIS